MCNVKRTLIAICISLSFSSFAIAGCCNGPIFEELGNVLQSGALSNVAPEPSRGQPQKQADEQRLEQERQSAAARETENLAEVARVWPGWRSVVAGQVFTFWFHSKIDADLNFEGVARIRPDLANKIMALYVNESIDRQRQIQSAELEGGRIKVDQAFPGWRQYIFDQAFTDWTESESQSQFKNLNPIAFDNKARTDPDFVMHALATYQVAKRHPGWENTVRSKSFKDWLGKQPQSVQHLAASDRPEDAILLLDLYDAAGESRSTQRRPEMVRSRSLATGTK